ncbi:hypothetical protein HK405_004630 [Cladochytrium tenue]|nr:hypothetical protein HK405_004630 [Cladochytrium tenue]
MATRVGRSLLLALVVDAAVQVAFFAVSAAAGRTEVLFDLSGALTYLACVVVTALVPDPFGGGGAGEDEGSGAVRSLAVRQIIVAVFVVVWCARLGGFLFVRVLRTPDKRFDGLKKNFLAYSVPWALQIVWIYLTALAAFIVISNSSAKQAPLGWSDGIGIVIWVFGFMVETVADTQNGVPILEKSSERRYGNLPEYQRYKAVTSTFFLWPPKKLTHTVPSVDVVPEAPEGP